jgi:hypothetical protein
MIVVIQRGEEIETISDTEIEAYDINMRTGHLDLYKSPEERTRICTETNKVTFKHGNKAVAVFDGGHR